MYPCAVHDDHGIEYACVEAAFQAFKTDDLDQRRKLARMSGPEAKKAGRKLSLVDNWEEKKVGVMRKLLMEKFSRPKLMARLSAVEGEIVEDSTWGDTFWGRCRGTGKNVLGQLLMEIRDAANRPGPSVKGELEHPNLNPGCIVITSMSGIKTAMANIPCLDEAWFVVRDYTSLGGGLPDLGGVKSCWVNHLSPSNGLLDTCRDIKKQGSWNHEAFMDVFVPRFLEEMRADVARTYLNALYRSVHNLGKHIALVSRCREDAACHRSILAGLMQGVGLTVLNETGSEVNYALYSDMYRGKSDG